MKELRTLGPENIVIAIAGNKSDLESEREVDVADARAYAKEIGAHFTETSAKTGTDVTELFTDISRHLPSEEASDKSGIQIVSYEKNKGKKEKGKGGCC